MRKSVLLILFISIFSNSYSQNQSKSELSKFRIGIFYSLNNNLSSETINQTSVSGFFANYDKHNYSTGVTIEYELFDSFSLNSGINYSNNDFTGSFYNRLGPLSLRPFLYPEGDIKLQYIEVPLGARYYFLSTKTKLFVDLGIINQFIINTTDGNDASGFRQFTDKKYILSGKIGTGIEYNINHKIAVQLSTQYNTGLTTLFSKDSSDFKTKFLSFSLGLVKRL